MGLRPLACWDCVFKSRRGCGCLLSVRVLCCQGEVCEGPIPRSEKTYRVCVCVIECDQVQQEPPS
jgi:hypothetical protein